MKKYIFIVLSLMFLCGNVVYATSYDKSIRKEAKKLQKEGWKPLPNAISLEEQLKLSFDMEYAIDSLVNCIYIFGTAESKPSPSVPIAEQVATEKARAQLSAWEANGIDVFSTQRGDLHYNIELKGEVIPVMAMYKQLPEGVVVLIKLASKYDYK